MTYCSSGHCSISGVQTILRTCDESALKTFLTWIDAHHISEEIKAHDIYREKLRFSAPSFVSGSRVLLNKTCRRLLVMF